MAPYDKRDGPVLHYAYFAPAKHPLENEDPLFREGYINLHREQCLLECISVESDVDLTLQLVKQLLEEPDDSKRMVRKVKNLYNAITNTFPSTFFPELSIEHFTPSHRQIGDGLIDNAESMGCDSPCQQKRTTCI